MTETIEPALVRLALVRLRRDIDAELDRRGLAAAMQRHGICDGAGFATLGPRPPPLPREGILFGSGLGISHKG